MENAYVNVYFSAPALGQGEGEQGGGKRSLANTRRKDLGGDVELADRDLGALDLDQAQANPLHAAAPVTVLNEELDPTLDTLKEYSGDASESVAAAQLVSLLDGLINRMIATTAENSNETFWDVVGHSAVLHRLDLDALHAFVLERPGEYSVYIELLMKVFQLFQVHIRIGYGCSAEDAHTYDHSTAYRIGPKTYTVSEVENLYNNALAHALIHGVALPATS